MMTMYDSNTEVAGYPDVSSSSQLCFLCLLLGVHFVVLIWYCNIFNHRGRRSLVMYMFLSI